tara:strand:- start:732 stop:908 length:177 start_codon:yes stop_codon:yes gene_type:complete
MKIKTSSDSIVKMLPTIDVFSSKTFHLLETNPGNFLSNKIYDLTLFILLYILMSNGFL